MKRNLPKPPERIIDLWVQPRASGNEVVGYQDHILRVRVTAPPTGGEANRMCRQLLAKTFGVAPSRIEIISGLSSRKKRIRIQGENGAIPDVSPASTRGLRKR